MSSSKIVRYCDYCKSQEVNQKFKCCSCMHVQYCNKECQQAHWKVHRDQCSHYKEKIVKELDPAIQFFILNQFKYIIQHSSFLLCILIVFYAGVIIVLISLSMYSSEESNIAIDMLEAFREATEALRKAALLQHRLHDLNLVLDYDLVGSISNELNCLAEISQLIRNIVANTQALECKIHGYRGEIENLRTYKRMKEAEHGALIGQVQHLLIQVGKLESRNLQYRQQQDAMQNTIARLEQTCTSLQNIIANTTNINNTFLTIV